MWKEISIDLVCNYLVKLIIQFLESVLSLYAAGTCMHMTTTHNLEKKQTKKQKHVEDRRKKME